MGMLGGCLGYPLAFVKIYWLITTAVRSRGGYVVVTVHSSRLVWSQVCGSCSRQRPVGVWQGRSRVRDCSGNNSDLEVKVCVSCRAGC